MALSLAAAAIGSAVIGGASSVYNASQQKGAAKAADKANQAALAQSLAAQEKAQTTVNNVQNPYLQPGNAANAELAQRMGLSTGSGGSAGQVDGAAYLANNPDVAAAWADPAWQAKFGGDANAFSKWHNEASGASEGRELPMVQSGRPSDPGDVPFAPQEWSPGATRTGPSFSWGSAPREADVSEAAFKKSPLYNLGLAEGQANLNTSFGAKGLLRSGAAVKGALDFARDNVNKNYSSFADIAMRNKSLDQSGFNADLNVFGAQRNAFDNNRNFDYGQYTDGLNYNANRYDTANNNLFRLAGSGQQAANTVSNAATGFADKAGDIYGGQAASTAGRAAAVADANAGMVSGIAGIGQNLFRQAGSAGIGARTTPQQPISPYGYGNNSLVRPPINVPDLRTMPQPVF